MLKANYVAQLLQIGRTSPTDVSNPKQRTVQEISLQQKTEALVLDSEGFCLIENTQNKYFVTRYNWKCLVTIFFP